MGSYANPQEAYGYYAFPYSALEMEHPPLTGSERSVFNSLKSYAGIGKWIKGHVLHHTSQDLTFSPDMSNQPIVEDCTTGELGEEDVAKFAKAAREQWFFIKPHLR